MLIFVVNIRKARTFCNLTYCLLSPFSLDWSRNLLHYPMCNMAMNNISYPIYQLLTRTEKGCITKIIPFFFVQYRRKQIDKYIGVQCKKSFKSSWCYSRFHFSIRQKWPILCLRIQVLQSKQVILFHSTPNYLRCIVDQTTSRYDQTMLYRWPPRCTSAQHTTCGEWDHSRPFFNRLKNLYHSPRPLRAGLTNPGVF